MIENGSKLNNNEKVLLDLLANSLFRTERKLHGGNVNWSGVWYEAFMQTVTLSAFSNVGSELNSDEKLLYIKENLNQEFASNVKIDFEHTRIHNIMTDAGIPYMILKGFASALYYPDPMLRSMGDVDFYVSADRFDEASEVLLKYGFETVQTTHDCHDVFIGNNCRYEMHFEPAGIPGGKAGEIIRKYLNDAFECAREVKTEVGTIVVPSVFHHGLIILLHMCHHLTNEGIGLRHLCDWAVFAASLTDEEFCGIFEEKLRNAGLWRFACILTQTAEIYLGCPSKEWAGEPEPELTGKIMADIFAGGNFGQKSGDRGHERLLISDNPEKENSMFRQFFASLNSIVYSKWKISKKLKILLPFGWIFFGGRYLLRSFFGKRPKVRPLEVTRKAAERKVVYAQLSLFELAEKP